LEVSNNPQGNYISFGVQCPSRKLLAAKDFPFSSSDMTLRCTHLYSSTIKSSIFIRSAGRSAGCVTHSLPLVGGGLAQFHSAPAQIRSARARRPTAPAITAPRDQRWLLTWRRPQPATEAAATKATGRGGSSSHKRRADQIQATQPCVHTPARPGGGQVAGFAAEAARFTADYLGL
jgi:hypothetical protein